MHNRNLIVFVAFFVCLLAVSAVSANDANDAVTASVDAGRASLSSSNVMIEDNLQINEDNSTLTHVDSTHDQLKIENDDEKLSVLNDENVLSSAETFNGTTFSELRSKINSLKNGDVLDLTSNVTQDGNSYIAISKSITINGNGITIDAKGKSRIFNIQSSATVVLNNITFTNGYHGEQAGAINIENGKLTVTSSNFIKNIAQEDGGAIYNKGTLNITDTYFIANKANKWDGGAIFNNGGTKMTLADSHFINNTAGDGGGAIINLGDCNVNITDSYFINNIAYVRQNYDGGAIFSFTSNVNIERSYFANNKAKNYGGAVESWYGKTNIEDSYFIANKVDRWNGGAVFADSCDFTVTGSLFINNTANHYGGALYISNNNNEKVTNSVFINNKADGRNPNTYNIDNDRTTVYSKDSPLIINDNWWGTNDPVWKDLIYGANPSSYAVLNVSADAVIIPWGSAVKLDYAFYKNGTDELLSLPARPIELSATGGQLDNTSGNLTGVFSTEFSCDTLGDYEITAKVDNQEIKIAEKVILMLYVNSTAVPGGDGKSEATPFQTLKEALDVAVDDYTLIRIASGTYTGNDNIGLTVDKNLTLEKYGDGEATFDAQGLDRILTVDAGAVNVIGLTFRNGKFAGNGGAIYFDGLGKVENCTFINNTALEGGAIYFYTASTVTNSDFTNNSAASGGGAIYFVEIGDVADCTFANNKATTYGGAIEFAAEGSLTNCNFTNNTANKDGGAVCFDKTCNVTNCNFTNNTADQNGGAIKFNSTGNLTNSNFAGNIAKGNKCYGGAVWINSGSVENCNFTDNKATGLESRGNAIYFENNGNVTNCNFTNHNVANCGAVFFFKNANLRNCNFINNTNALFIVEYGDVESCNFINNKANKDPGNIGAARVNHGHVINCNFTNNTASHYTGALDMLGGTVENCTFINNSAADEGGALGFMYEAKVMNCNFTNNKATSGCGGAIYFFNPGEVINCYFTNNTAKNGGAVYFMNGGNVARCNFTGNKAIAGSAIYFYGDKYERSISNSSFLNNRANADADTPLTVTINENDITIIFKGQNNYLNAIYSRFDREFKFSNVTYWGAKGISNTDTDAPVKSNCEAGQNITVKGVANGNILDITSVTDDEGKIVLDISAGDNYYITVRHDEDSYYTEVEKVISKNMAYTVNVTSQTTHNKTVNVTAKSDIFNEVLPGRLLFILPDGTKINATYASNGIWWTVHKFDDYTEYDVNASYVGLDNVTFKNATINITRADSTITLDNIIRDYGNSTNITITTEGATAVTAKINDKDVDVIDNYTIPISGLGAGNYTLTVTTTPDEDHNSVTKTVKITVNKRFTEITLTNETLDLKAKESVGTGAALTPGDAGTLNYTSSNEDVVKVENGKIIAIAAGKANYCIICR
ncbi:right-handed parallel beta-helix repeat-containing protein [uncultured Methanobrevibacter sp.]|uniref:right-handed parallel beta-helix repeat-containing protein n=1 Tax=uncultured Methanobrevibacter sp. TaxID=253161 RepID=UPI0025FCFA6D|nr:right-handed parallel beta-helix repeat-containing protein [uncultured Methanobrevibacter sp.]